MRPSPDRWRHHALKPVRHHALNLAHHPRVAMSLKAAVGATLAWVVALQLPGAAAEYPFYAPLGAVVAVYPTVARSFREAVQSVAAIALGAALAVVADNTFGLGAWVVAMVVLLGVLLGGLPWLGAHRSYVATAGLFVLVIGQGDELEYAASYAGLFLLGAVIALGVNAAFPSLPVHRMDHTLGALRGALGAHLAYLADHFTVDPSDAAPLTDRGPGRPGLTDLTSSAREAAREGRDSLRANRRARRVPDAVGTRYEAFRTLERVVLLVDDLYLLLDDPPWQHDVHGSSEDVREPVARALRELATAVGEVGLHEPDPDQRAAADAALRDLALALSRRQAEGVGEAEILVIGTIGTTLRRCLSLLTPAEMLAPSPAHAVRQGVRRSGGDGPGARPQRTDVRPRAQRPRRRGAGGPRTARSGTPPGRAPVRGG